MGNEVIKIDNSILSDVYSCSTRTWVKYVQYRRMREQGDAGERMKVGSLFHGLFERCLQQFSLEGNIALLEEGYRAAFPEGVSKEKYEWPNLEVIARVWLSHASQHFRQHTPIAIEQYLEMPLTSDIMFFGTVDAITQDHQGNLWIVESKTTGWLREENKRYWTRGSQGKGYWALVTAHYGKEPKGVIWNALEIGKTPPWDGNLNKKCSKHGVKYLECQPLHVTQEVIGPVVYTREQLGWWWTQVIRGAQRYQLLKTYTPGEISWIPTEGQFSYPGCSTCDLADWCHAGRLTSHMAGMMVEQPWPPRPLYEEE